MTLLKKPEPEKAQLTTQRTKGEGWNESTQTGGSGKN